MSLDTTDYLQWAAESAAERLEMIASLAFTPAWEITETIRKARTYCESALACSVCGVELVFEREIDGESFWVGIEGDEGCHGDSAERHRPDAWLKQRNERLKR